MLLGYSTRQCSSMTAGRLFQQQSRENKCLSWKRCTWACSLWKQSESLRHFTHKHFEDFSPLPPIVCLFLPSDFLLLDVAPFFPVTGAWTWNDLPSHITSSPSLMTFKQRLKMLLPRPFLEVAVCCLGDVKKHNKIDWLVDWHVTGRCSVISVGGLYWLWFIYCRRWLGWYQMLTWPRVVSTLHYVRFVRCRRH